MAVDQNGCPFDSDKDGIADAIDKCPDTPAGIKVDEFGCPVDSDNDGVPDYLDECSDTPKGTMVDQKGCPVSETNLNKFLLAADDIFAPNSAMIKVEGKKYLDKVIAQLQKFPDKRWRIEGHMDSNGSKRYLRNLSLDRAKAVLEYFNYFGGLKRENFQVFG
ncbi:MAG: OmpA family protein, partial [Ignavibacteriaceae bacterium]|nr:OmpA family protein [Ignavibacteriaceae bacterium]